MKNIIYVIAVFSIFALGAFFITAQDESNDSEPMLRLVCIETIGCLHTPLDDEMLDAQFGTELARYESGGDFEPLGVWNWATDRVTICDEPLTFNDEPPMVLITEIEESDDIYVQKAFASERLYTRIGEGVYVGEETFGDGGTGIIFSHFLIVIDETTMMSIGIGTRYVMDQDPCPETRHGMISYLGPE